MGTKADVEGQRVRLSANAAVAVTFEEEQSGKPVLTTEGRRPGAPKLLGRNRNQQISFPFYQRPADWI